MENNNKKQLAGAILIAGVLIAGAILLKGGNGGAPDPIKEERKLTKSMPILTFRKDWI